VLAGEQLFDLRSAKPTIHMLQDIPSSQEKGRRIAMEADNPSFAGNHRPRAMYTSYTLLSSELEMSRTTDISMNSTLA
jgi:hypothetical protein